MKIKTIHARQILDSRGNPTIEADVMLENGSLGRVSVPSGASTGMNEAIELRDQNSVVFGGLGVLKAVNNINSEIAKKLIDMEAGGQELIDETLIKLDGTADKSRLGANAILAVSLAVAKACANSQNIPLYEYIKNISGNEKEYLLPMPMVNIINGGKHAHGSSDIQEFMIMPMGAKSFSQAVQMSAEIFHTLGNVLINKGYENTVGDEGGYAPKLQNGNTETLELIKEAVEKSGYVLGIDISLALDIASSELFENNFYNLKTENKKLINQEMIDYYESIINKYPVISIEDGLEQNDWSGWQKLNEKLGNIIQLVGDDLLVTNTKFLKKAIEEKACNAILIKPNQIGTLTETIEAVKMAQVNNFNVIISHRSGETEDTTIAHLAVGLSTGQIKTGSMSRSERIAKYNELLRIEEELGALAKFSGKLKN